jgi:hypothetical protein
MHALCTVLSIITFTTTFIKGDDEENIMKEEESIVMIADVGGSCQ